MQTFEERAKAIISGLSPMARTFLPGGLLDLLLDICIALDNQRKGN